MRHVPVLLNEVAQSLDLKPGMNIIDCTVGDGGHSEKILEKIKPNGKVLALDADAESLFRAKKYLYAYEPNVNFIRSNFVFLKEVVAKENFDPVNGVLMDFGWSSPQFEERGKGFSFLKPEEQLDMRYEQTGESAKDILNSFAKNELEKIFREFGEEKLSREIAEEITTVRKSKPLEKVGDLVEIILRVYRKKLKTEKEIPWIGGLHPATKVFQAVRMQVNNELNVIENVLPQAVEVLASGGRLVVITFHSLEDRIVKHYFQKINNKLIKIVTKKPIIATEAESNENPRARSAKLRVIEKL